MRLPKGARTLVLTASAVALALAIAAFALGRAVGASDPLRLAAPRVTRVAPPDAGATLVVPSPVAIPSRVGR